MVDTYRNKFINKENPLEYDEQQYAKRSYGEILWSIEREQLLGFLERFRQVHSNIDYLDFAAGTGRIISALEDYVDSAIGIEISPAMVEIAQKKLQSGLMMCRDITAPGVEVEGKYDLITAFRFFLNAEQKLGNMVMNGLAARLKDESSRIVFNNHGNLYSHKIVMWPFHAVRNFGRAYRTEGNYMTFKQARKLTAEAGLVIESVIGCGVLGPKSLGIIPFEQLLRIESQLSKTSFISKFGVNQMYVARLDSR